MYTGQQSVVASTNTFNHKKEKEKEKQHIVKFKLTSIS